MSDKFFKEIQKGNKEKVEQMLRKNPDLILVRDRQGLSPLMTALYYHEPEIADLLLERMMALSIYEAAATGKMVHLIRDLAREPELVNAYSGDGFQPLGLAAFFGHVAIAEYLIKAGAEVNSPSKNKMGVTPLQSAVAGGNFEIARLLLEAGADPNVRERDGGYTPLHAAAQNGNIEIVRILLFNGANLEVKNKAGKTPLDLAQAAGHKQAAELLNAGITRRFRGSRIAK